MPRLIILNLTLLLAVPTFGQDAPTTMPDEGTFSGLTPVSISLNPAFRSKYVFSNGFNSYDDPVIQTDFFVLTKCGLNLDLWTSVPADLSDIGENYATEIDVTLGWLGKIGDYNVSVGIAYYDLYHTLTPEGSDFITLSGEISRDFQLTPTFNLSPFFRVETNFTPNGFVDGDTLPRLGTRAAWKINDRVTWASKAMVVYDPGIAGGDAAWIGNIETNLLWKMGKSTVLELPFLRLVDPLTSVSDGRQTEFIAGCGVTFNF